MTYHIAGNTAVENTRSLAHSALPNAPVIEDEVRRPGLRIAVRARFGEVLRAAARQELRLAERVDPTPRCEPQLG
ncbi:MAG: hypothetical protein ACRDP9_07705 [Kribbellaceae bacterium]|nr:hypothetical protein [Kribbellaceae bacterium]